MSKKAQSMPINIIIVAAIALIVLVILVAIFAGRMGLFGQKVASTEQKCTDFKNSEATPAAWQSAICSAGYNEIFTATDAIAHAGEHCCVVKVAQ